MSQYDARMSTKSESDIRSGTIRNVVERTERTGQKRRKKYVEVSRDIPYMVSRKHAYVSAMFGIGSRP